MTKIRLNPRSRPKSPQRPNPKAFLRQFVTADQPWIQHYTSETKQQSKEWTGKEESTSKKEKSVSSVGKIMDTVFRDAKDILLVDYLHLTPNFMLNLWTNRNKRSGLTMKKIQFHQDNKHFQS